MGRQIQKHSLLESTELQQNVQKQSLSAALKQSYTTQQHLVSLAKIEYRDKLF